MHDFSFSPSNVKYRKCITSSLIPASLWSYESDLANGFPKNTRCNLLGLLRGLKGGGWKKWAKQRGPESLDKVREDIKETLYDTHWPICCLYFTDRVNSICHTGKWSVIQTSSTLEWYTQIISEELRGQGNQKWKFSYYQLILLLTEGQVKFF